MLYNTLMASMSRAYSKSITMSKKMTNENSALKKLFELDHRRIIARMQKQNSKAIPTTARNNLSINMIRFFHKKESIQRNDGVLAETLTIKMTANVNAILFLTHSFFSIQPKGDICPKKQYTKNNKPQRRPHYFFVVFHSFTCPIWRRR